MSWAQRILSRMIKSRAPSADWPAVAWAIRRMTAHRWLIVGLSLSTIGSAMTEGLGIATLVPLLDAVNRKANAFASIPLIDRISGLFATWPVARELELIAVLLVLVALLRAMFSYATTYLAQVISLTVDQDIKIEITRLANLLDFERVQSLGSTTLLSYTMGLSTQTGIFCSLVATAVANLLMLSVYVAICLTLSWQLTLLAAGALFFTIQFVRVPLMRRTLAVGRRRTQALIDMNRVIFGGFAGAKLLRLVAGAGEHEGHVAASLGRYITCERHNAHLQALVDPMFQTLVAVVISLMLFVSAEVLGNEIVNRIPLVLLFLFVLYRVVNPVQTLNRTRLGLAAVLNAVQTIFAFVQEAGGNREPDGTLPYAGLPKRISLESVSFRYRLAEGSAVDTVSFDIPARKMTALVGPSGAGKTTLVGLVTRIYQPQSGRISADGINISELRVADWRSHLAVVTQDTFLFDDTVAANLRLSRPRATDEEIEAAARRAEAHDFIMQLPQGYATPVGERGVRLSGGQQQRLALARALLAKPDLLILDEATSNLDAETEHLVSRTLSALVGECGILVIAHRLATVQRADQIVVLDQGRVVETGTHESLMYARGKYYGMVSRQMFATESPSPVAKEVGAIDAMKI